MKQVTYVGLDVHKKSIVAVHAPAKGTPAKIETTNDARGWNRLAQALEEHDVHAVYEASSCGFELCDEMTARGWDIVVVAPTNLERSTKSAKTKTDLRDAVALRAKLVGAKELGLALPTVWIPPIEVRQDRELVRRRLRIGESLSMIKTSILSLLQIHKVRVPETIRKNWTQIHLKWLKELQLAGPVKAALESQLRELEFLMAEQKRIQEEVVALAQEARYRAQVEAVTVVPGVAELTAMVFLTELGDVKRFKNRRQVANYLGLTPCSYESGEVTDRKGHITRLGPGRIRKVLNQAAWSLVRCRREAREHFAAVSARRGKKRALVAEMRRLGIELWHRAMSAA